MDDDRDRGRDRRDDGQATPLMLTAVALVAVMLLGLAPLGRTLAHRAQARTAADAAALAGAADGESAAREVARANGADLRSYQRQGDEVVVKVAIDGVSAFGRARRHEVEGATGIVGSGASDRAGLAPVMLAALSIADRLLGRPVPVASGYRSPAEQEALWERRHSNPYPVAQPGHSRHERGMAIDVPRGFVGELLTVATRAGLCQPLPRTDPVHFELCGARDAR